MILTSGKYACVVGSKRKARATAKVETQLHKKVSLVRMPLPLSFHHTLACFGIRRM